MGAINGTSILLYTQGRCIAMQKGLSIALNDALIDGTSKDSGAWKESAPGLRDVKIDFNALYGTGLLTDNPKVQSAKDTMDYIINRNNLLVAILGGDYPFLGEADMSSLSFDAPVEKEMTLSGSVKIKGQLYQLIDSMVQMITDPDGGGYDYATCTHSGLALTSVINSSGTHYVRSNVISVANGGVYKLATFLTFTSGELPFAVLYDNTSAEISNAVRMSEGLNLITLTCTSTDASASLKFRNSLAANWSTSSLFLFRVS
jgi:predicted secreted protein